MPLYVKWPFLWRLGCARLSADKNCARVCVVYLAFTKKANVDKTAANASAVAVSYADANLAR